MKPVICFSDLTHVGHSCNSMPYGVGLVAAYAKKELGDRVDINIFKAVDDLIAHVEAATPHLACFSNYIWNKNLSYEVAKRIKERSPKTVIVFGGPNYPLEEGGQVKFMADHPAIDFYFVKEGEIAFTAFLQEMLNCDFDVRGLKEQRKRLDNCNYIIDGDFICGGLADRPENMDDLPSPYLNGLLDPFLTQGLMSLIQTARGCPFKCTFCQEGVEYYNRVKRYSRERIKSELEYIAQRTSFPDVHCIDSNFGMFKGDVDIASDIHECYEKYNWPKYFIGLSGKNQKAKVLEAASIIRGEDAKGPAVWLSASVQSLDQDVLESIKRGNVAKEELMFVATESDSSSEGSSTSFSELILCLPGDTKKAHFNSVHELIDAGMTVVRSHQFIMLNGSEAATDADRQKFGMVTRFRIMPATTDSHELFGDKFTVPEIDEICVANNTMPFEDYIDCRMLNLSLEIFYNNGLFSELTKLLKGHGVSISDFVMNVHMRATSAESPLAGLYEDFFRETKELFETEEEAANYLKQPGILERYVNGELGNNEQMLYRAVAIVHHMDKLHDIAFGVGGEMLESKGVKNEKLIKYMDELAEYSLLRKRDILSLEAGGDKKFNFDFVDLEACNFNGDPLSFLLSKEKNISFKRTREQKDYITSYMKLYGDTNAGIGNILGMAANVSSLYRRVESA